MAAAPDIYHINIYFISGGTNDSILGKKTNNLTYFGFNELINLRKNNFFKTKILNYANNTLFFTSSDKDCIQSSYILFSHPRNINVKILRHLNKIKYDKQSFINFFNKNLRNLGNSDKSYMETLNYGDNINIKPLILQLPVITNKPNSKNYYISFSASMFKSSLEKIIDNDRRVNRRLEKNIIIMCRSEAIRDILKYMNYSEYNKIKNDKFENSSIWKVECNYKIPNGSAIRSEITYDLFSKIYPTPKIHEPLKIINNKYYLYFKNKFIPIFEKKDDIKQNLLNYINNSSENNEENNEETNIITTKKKIKNKPTIHKIDINPFSLISNYK